jgi:hypothetical protein
MKDYLEVFDTSRHGRRYLVRSLGVIVSFGTFLAFPFLAFGGESGISTKVCGWILAVAGVAFCGWAWFGKYRCPKCGRGMKIRKGRRRPGFTPILLVCERCEIFIDTGIGEE